MDYAGGGGGGGAGLALIQFLQKMMSGTQALAANTQALASRTVAAANNVWKLGWAERGRQIEALLMKNVNGWFGAGNNVKTIDAAEDLVLNAMENSQGLATSVKSMDLAAASYQNASGITSTLTRAVNALSNYKGLEYVKDAVGNRVWVGQITQRVLNVAIPDMALTSEQAAALQAVREWAAQLPNMVKVVFTVVQ
ncbi:MAG TPA: hypothetical protein VD969_11405 [Symbiobacteriaceae bacterium]|nr:hypothetical protein [Symbiobacteriaceae bacterium]